MTAPAFIYTSEPWAAQSFGRPIFAPSFTLERISADHLPQSSPASPLYRPHLEPVGRAQEAVHVLRKNLVHRCPFIAISFAFLGSCFKKFYACVNYLTLGRRKDVNRAAAGIRSSCSSAMISSSSAVPLRPFAEIMPSSAICPRIAFDSIVR